MNKLFLCILYFFSRGNQQSMNFKQSLVTILFFSQWFQNSSAIIFLKTAPITLSVSKSLHPIWQGGRINVVRELHERVMKAITHHQAPCTFLHSWSYILPDTFSETKQTSIKDQKEEEMKNRLTSD